ncbi:hypothetical protein K470DRAFT_22738 [Piedraia hortae CBS 480.64]|uniref:Uncharacterized protein n=1 Tax=Piedraia hortae CBS 480.64 TaxID=1314780 RepID=A0A6A7C552_9PEZI|nr:hypothetical protein K470DRAFT_22738 [Piedraia hortae CBS 480.64]
MAADTSPSHDGDNLHKRRKKNTSRIVARPPLLAPATQQRPDVPLAPEFVDHAAPATLPVRRLSFVYLAPEQVRCRPLFVEPQRFTGQVNFTMYAPGLVDIFAQTWHLRAYIHESRAKMGEWRDHVVINDSFGIENALRATEIINTPGSPAGAMAALFKQVTWLFFHRTIQPSRSSLVFSQTVHEGIQSLRAVLFQQPAPAQLGLLTPLVLLGFASFMKEQRRAVLDIISDVRRTVPTRAMDVIENMLERLWVYQDYPDEKRSWDWEATWKEVSNGFSLTQAGISDPFLSELLAPSYLWPDARPPLPEPAQYRVIYPPPSNYTPEQEQLTSDFNARWRPAEMPPPAQARGRMQMDSPCQAPEQPPRHPSEQPPPQIIPQHQQRVHIHNNIHNHIRNHFLSHIPIPSHIHIHTHSHNHTPCHIPLNTQITIH